MSLASLAAVVYVLAFVALTFTLITDARRYVGHPDAPTERFTQVLVAVWLVFLLAAPSAVDVLAGS